MPSVIHYFHHQATDVSVESAMVVAMQHQLQTTSDFQTTEEE